GACGRWHRHRSSILTPSLPVPYWRKKNWRNTSLRWAGKWVAPWPPCLPEAFPAYCSLPRLFQRRGYDNFHLVVGVGQSSLDSCSGRRIARSHPSIPGTVHGVEFLHVGHIYRCHEDAALVGPGGCQEPVVGGQDLFGLAFHVQRSVVGHLPGQVGDSVVNGHVGQTLLDVDAFSFLQLVFCPSSANWGSGWGQFEYLTQVSEIGRIIAHRFLRCIRNLGDRLAIAADHLHDYLQRFMPKIIGEDGANTERYAAPPGEVARQFDGAGNGECVGKHQGLGPRVRAVGCEVLQYPVTPDEGVTGIVAGTIKQLAEIHVEIAQEGV